MKLNGSMRFASASAMVWVMAPLAVSAQEVRGSGSLEEVVVTAQKREQSINDVGMTIQAASGDALINRGIQGPEDLAKLVPGFTFTESIYSTPVFTLRGIGLYDATFGAPPAVAVYTDQIPRNFPVMSEALDLDLERIEVLKGPQGTLFGQSSTGGAVNYITAKPTDTFTSGFDASYERFDKVELSGFISGPLSDTLKARLAVRAIDGGAWQYSQSRRDDENGSVRKLMGRLTLDWSPTDTIDVEMSFTGARDRSDPIAPQYAGSIFNVYSAAALAAANANAATNNPYGVVNDALYASLTTPGSPNFDASFVGRQETLVRRMNDTTPANATLAAGSRAILGTADLEGDPRAAEWTPGLLQKSDNNYYQGTLRADIDITDTVTLTSVSAYARQELDYANDLDGTTGVGVDVPLFGTVKAFNQEIRLAGITDRVNWIVGASYDDSTSDQSNYFRLDHYSGNDPTAGALAPIRLTLNDFSSTLETYAGYVNGEFEITPQWSVQAGARYTRNEQTGTYCYNDPAIDTSQSTAATFSLFQTLFTGQALPPIQPGECFPLGDGLGGTTFGRATLTPLERSLEQNNTSYRVGVNYKFDSDALIYATVSQGYKTGLFSAIGASSTSQYAPAVQEKVVAYETGFKVPLFDQRLNLNGAVFYYDYSDKQVRGRILDTIYGLLEKMVNVPESYIWGVEGEVYARPIHGLTVSAGATYLKSKVSGSFFETPDGSAVYNAAGYTGDFKGSELPFTPELSATADLQYEWTLAGGLVPFLGTNVLYQDSLNTTFSNAVLQADDFEIDAYTTVDVRAGIRAGDDRWQVTLFGRNVFDETYTTSITTYLDTRFRLTGRPATYGVALKMRF